MFEATKQFGHIQMLIQIKLYGLKRYVFTYYLKLYCNQPCNYSWTGAGNELRSPLIKNPNKIRVVTLA